MIPVRREVRSQSEQDTVRAGRDLAADVRAGDVVLLSGALGAGKTAFVRGLAEGLGANPDDVSSPTFTIVQEYRGRVLLQHADLYRLSSREVDDLALEELLEDAVLAVEWSERWNSPPAGSIRVSIEGGAGDQRTIAISR
jgi:tRNA threonylcarbamoyladenosine biosynthesis protein TsaE